MDKQKNFGLRIVAVMLAVVLFPFATYGVARLATRSQGVYFASRTSIDIPDGGTGFWNKNGLLQARSATGSDYVAASPMPSPSAIGDAGVALGAGGALLIGTKVTGNSGSTNYSFSDVVQVLKTRGVLTP